MLQVFQPAFLQRAHAAEVIGDIVLHAAVKPVDDRAEAGALVQSNQRVQILEVNGLPGELRL